VDAQTGNELENRVSAGSGERPEDRQPDVGATEEHRRGEAEESDCVSSYTGSPSPVDNEALEQSNVMSDAGSEDYEMEDVSMSVLFSLGAEQNDRKVEDALNVRKGPEGDIATAEPGTQNSVPEMAKSDLSYLI
jgi:hypothetical protein